MSDDPKESVLLTVLEPGEILLWRGRIGFGVASSPIFLLTLAAIAAYAVWGTWGSYSLAEFCPPAEKVAKCGSFYAIVPSCLLMMLVVQCFDTLERRALTSGRSHGAVMLTDRRLIRLSNWLWRRVRAYDHRNTKPKRGLGGVIRFGSFGNICLSRADADHVLALIGTNGSTTT